MSEATLQFIDGWTSRLVAGAPVSDCHRWLWRAWRQRGAAIVRDLNARLRLRGDDLLRRDVPHWFAGSPDAAGLVFLNINPGWHPLRNLREQRLVRVGEAQAFDFASRLFTQYPIRVGHMHWWNSMIGLAWRVMHGEAPRGVAAAEKRQWAEMNVGSFELLPIHSRRSGFLGALQRSGRVEVAILGVMRAAVVYAAARTRGIVVVASSPGAALVRSLAPSLGWRPIRRRAGTLVGATAYRTPAATIVAIPRPLAGSFSGVNFDRAAADIRALAAP